jgi:hypothetical protein
MKRRVFAVAVLFAVGACGAQRLKVEPVTIQPIHMTIDVNVHDQAEKPGRAP